MSKPDPSIEQEMRRTAKRICRGIHSKRVREQTEQEYLEHMEDHYYSLLLKGLSEQKALQQTIEGLGSLEELCHMLASVHNRIPADLGKTLLRLGIRTCIAAFVGCMLWAWGFFHSQPITMLIPLLIFAGLSPIRYARAFILRLKASRQIRKICKQNGFGLEQHASVLLSVFIPARRPEWTITTAHTTYYIHFLACPHRHVALHFFDSYAYTLTLTRGQGARFADRSPFRFNLIKTPDQTYSEQSRRYLFFPVGPEYRGEPIKRILLINPVPSLISYQNGTSVEYIGNGDTIFGFTLCDSTHFATELRKESL